MLSVDIRGQGHDVRRDEHRWLYEFLYDHPQAFAHGRCMVGSLQQRMLVMGRGARSIFGNMDNGSIPARTTGYDSRIGALSDSTAPVATWQKGKVDRKTQTVKKRNAEEEILSEA